MIVLLLIWDRPLKLTCQPSNSRNTKTYVTMAILACVGQIFVK